MAATLFWYWPHPHRAASPLVEAVVRPGDRIVVQALAAYEGVPLDPIEANYELWRQLPDPTSGSAWRNLVRRMVVRQRGVRRSNAQTVHLELLEYRVDWLLVPLLKGRGERRVTAAVHDVRPHRAVFPRPIETWLLRRLYRSLDAAVVFHEVLRRQLVDEFGVDPARVHVVAPVIVEEGGPERAQAARNDHILFFGSFRSNKGLDVLLDAIALMPEVDERRFVFVGTGDPMLEQQVRSLAAARDDVDVEIARVSDARADDALHNARVVVLPYTSFSSQSGVLLDAYRHHVPVIVTDVGALGATVRDDASGWVVPPGDVDALRRALDEARHDDVAVARAGAAIARALAQHRPGPISARFRTALGLDEVGTATPVASTDVPTTAQPVRRWRVRPSAAQHVVRRVLAHPSNADGRLRALVHVARCEVQARITGRPVLTPLGVSSVIEAHLHRGGSWRAVLANPPDHDEMLVWQQALAPGDLFVDIGAHAGMYTIWALDLGASVIAVEPVPALVEQLRTNLARNDYRADVIEAAVADRPGTMPMTGPDLLRGHLLVGDTPSDADAPGVIEVAVRTLDDIIGDRFVAGCKIDVEGAERLVLAGASRVLRERRVALWQLEWNDCSQRVLGEDRTPVAALLEANGYELCRPDADGLLVPLTDRSFGADVFARPTSA